MDNMIKVRESYSPASVKYLIVIFPSLCDFVHGYIYLYFFFSILLGRRDQPTTTLILCPLMEGSPPQLDCHLSVEGSNYILTVKI